jgi:hypothetical protein
MNDLQEQSKIIISVPARLQSPKNENDHDDDDFEPIINMQRTVYETHIDDLRRRIERYYIS